MVCETTIYDATLVRSAECSFETPAFRAWCGTAAPHKAVTEMESPTPKT